jgi:hypothetical protein
VTPCLRNQTFAAYPERCSKPRVQPGNILRCDPPFPWPPPAPCSYVVLQWPSL